MEAMSDVLSMNSDWDHQINMFWGAKRSVFHEPIRSTKAGTHVYITLGPSRRWTRSQTQRIAIGVIRYENLVQELLPRHRRTLRSSVNPGCLQSPINATDHNYNHYARFNSSSRSNSRENLHEMFRKGEPSGRYGQTTSSLFGEDDLIIRLQTSLVW